MELGKYPRKKDDFTDFVVKKFTPHIFPNKIYQSVGCGACSLATLTGLSPFQIKNTNKKNKNDWKDSFMVSYLRRAGFKVKKLTKCNLTDATYIQDKIREDNVLLISRYYIRGEQSWEIAFSDYLIHNFQILKNNYYEYINRPLSSCYLVCHPNWK